jgi:hypothetical protein
MKRKDEGEDWIKITKRLLLQKGKNAKEEIVQSIYPKLLQRYPRARLQYYFHGMNFFNKERFIT